MAAPSSTTVAEESRTTDLMTGGSFQTEWRGYERLVVDRLHETGIPMHLAQPARVRAFARACGYQAKTDPRDAQVLSHSGSVFREHDAGTPTLEEELRDLLRRRRQLVEQRVQELGRVDRVVSLAVAESANRHIARLEAEIEVLDRKYQERVQSSTPVAQRAALYRTVPGVGKLTAAILVAHRPELGLLDAKALTSLVGVASWSRDSGQKKGQRAVRAAAATPCPGGVHPGCRRLRRSTRPSTMCQGPRPRPPPGISGKSRTSRNWNIS